MIEISEKYLKELRTVGQGDGSLADIAYSALILASLDRPGILFQKYQHHLKILTLDVGGAKLASNSAVDRAKLLISVLHDHHEYAGNEDYYEDLQNANLMSVIDTRKGLPVSLGILYMHAARSQGWHVEGLHFPFHFLIRLSGKDLSSDGQVIMDPFNGGKILEARDLRALLHKYSEEGAELRPAYYEAIPDREILVRLLNNIKIRCLKVSDLGQAINILERLVMIDPHQAQHHYELGMLWAHVKQNDLAYESLTYCLAHIDEFKQNDLVEQQVINTLLDLDKQEAESQKNNILKLPEIDR